jgi:hypothetical protein
MWATPMTDSRPMPSVAHAETRPLNLVLTSVILALGILVPYLYGIWAGAVKPSWFTSALVSSILLWFYWRGYGWARYFTMLGQAIAIAISGSTLTGHQLLTIANLGTRESKLILIVELLASAYVFGWLLTPQGRRYFSAEARHRRESLSVAGAS